MQAPSTVVLSTRSARFAPRVKLELRKRLAVANASSTSLDESVQKQFKDTSVNGNGNGGDPAPLIVQDVSDKVIEQLENSFVARNAAVDQAVEQPLLDQVPDKVVQQKGIWELYTSALAAHPIPVKSATSFIGFCLGDIISQSIGGTPFDVPRMLRMMMFGMMMDGPIGHVWYTTLDRNVYPEDPTCTKAVISKTTLDQLVWAPFFSCVFFTFINLVQGQPELIWPEIHEKLVPMLIANYAIWPIAHLINFRFVPSQQRILYINVISVFWCAYLSYAATHSLTG